MKNLAVVVVTGVGLAYFAACTLGTDANLDHVRERSVARWQEVGYEVVGYKGYQWGATPFPGYGGARVWYSLRREGTNVIYTGSLWRWGDEIHVYGPRAIDAVTPNSR